MSKTIWHDVKDSPVPGEWVLYKTLWGSWKTTQNYHTAIKADYVMGWAYVEDLFAAVNQVEFAQRRLMEQQMEQGR